MNTPKIIATSRVTELVSIRIYARTFEWAHCDTSGFAIHTIHHSMGDRECWDGIVYNTEAEARAAANKRWTYIRTEERKALAAKAA